MKKIVTRILLGGSLLAACLNSQAQTVKIGYTKLDYILTQTPEAIQVSKQLAAQQTQAENELKRMQQEFEGKYGIYQKNAAQMSEVIRKDREAELQSLQSRIQEFSQKAQASIQGKYQQLITPVLTNIQTNIDAVAKENGYTHILNLGVGRASDILYASEENNITDLVLKKMGITPGKTPVPSAQPPTAPVKKAVVKKK